MTQAEKPTVRSRYVAAHAHREEGASQAETGRSSSGDGLYASRSRRSTLYGDEPRPRGARYDVPPASSAGTNAGGVSGARSAQTTPNNAARPYARPAGGSFTPRAGAPAPVPAGRRVAPRGSSAPAAHAASASSRRVTSLEGLRTLAILSVVAYHLGLSWLPSGHMGVVMFLVLSGYLVTCSVVRGFERARDRAQADGTVLRFGAGLGAFWWRRFKRIWPPMIAMIVLVALLCIAFNHVLLTKMRPDIAPALLGFENIWYIVHGLSYFEQIGAPSPLTHLWYVGLDAQLCVVVPLLLSAFLYAGASRSTIRRVFLGLALVSAVLMGVLFDPNADPSRVYYGPDTRAFAVLIGAWLGLAWPVGGLPVAGRGALLRLGARGVAALGGVALLGLVAIMVFVPSDAAFFYYGGMVLVCLLTVVLLVALLSPSNPLERLFSLKPLAWLGARSYALYLWHYPLIYLVGADGPAPWWLKLLAVVLSVGAAEATWLLVERPLSGGRVAAGVTQFAGWVRRGPLPAAGTFAATGVCGAVTLAALVGCLVVPDKVLVPKDAIVSTGEAAGRGMDLSDRAPGAADDSAVDDAGVPVAEAPEATPIVEAPIAPDDVVLPDGYFSLQASDGEQTAGQYDPVLVGDSVPGDTNFYDVFFGGFIDSYIGRHPFQAVDVLQDYLDQGVVGHVVVLAVFSNSLATAEQLDQLVAEAGPDRQVYLVGTVNPDGFQDEANAALMDCASRYDNVHYVDWPAVCAGYEDVYLYPDGTHLTPDGAPVYLDMIARAIAGDVVAAGGSIIPWDDPAAEDPAAVA